MAILPPPDVRALLAQTTDRKLTRRARSFAAKVQMAAETCDLCAELYNKAARRPVACPFCERQACASCTKQYLLGIFEEPHCAFCRTAWPTSVIFALLSRKFVLGALRKRRQELRLERERMLLPATAARRQMMAERVRAQRAQHRINGRLRDLQRDQDSDGALIAELESQRPASETRIRQIERRRTKRATTIAQLAAQQVAEFAEVALETAEFLIKCPAADCRGFVGLNAQCAVCKCAICRECWAITAEEHACSPADLETARLLRETCKTCPGCGMFIQRISGCRQMWCVQCHTAFDWHTGQKIAGHIHNPHYGQWRATHEHPTEETGPVKVALARVAALSTPAALAAARALDVSYGCTTSIVESGEFRLCYDRRGEETESIRNAYLHRKISEEAFERKIRRAANRADVLAEIHHLRTAFAHRLRACILRLAENPLEYQTVLLEVEESAQEAAQRTKELSTLFRVKESRGQLFPDERLNF